MTPIPLKQFMQSEAERSGLGKTTIFKRIQRGDYPHLAVIKIGTRSVFCIPMRKTYAEMTPEQQARCRERVNRWKAERRKDPSRMRCLCGNVGAYFDHYSSGAVCERCRRLETAAEKRDANRKSAGFSRYIEPYRMVVPGFAI